MTDPEDEDQAAYLMDAFAFVTDVIFANLAEEIDGDRFRLLLHASPAYGASIVPTGDRFQVVINRGVVDGLLRFCQIYADLEHPLMRTHIEELGPSVGGEDSVLGVSFHAGLIFLILHEVSHVAAGHVSFVGCAGDRFEEGWPDASAPEETEFRRMAELEADGMAMALLFEFQDELIASLRVTAADPGETTYPEQRGLLLGVVAAISLLEGMFARGAGVEHDYPYPAVRLLNLCSAYLRIVSPEMVVAREDDYWINRQDDVVIEAVSAHFKQTIAPTLFVLHDALQSLGIDSELQSIESDPSVVQSFMSDALLLLGGSMPHHSVDGRELVALSAKRPTFMGALAKFRELDLWHAFGAQED